MQKYCNDKKKVAECFFSLLESLIDREVPWKNSHFHLPHTIEQNSCTHEVHIKAFKLVTKVDFSLKYFFIDQFLVHFFVQITNILNFSKIRSLNLSRRNCHFLDIIKTQKTLMAASIIIRLKSICL